ncbi:MFS transporter [Phyllobacterium sp. 22229]|uniref:MFS transporter n=1 Tax=Phyllobacterium myrsinacearum TaxID=28101 RepID=A0A2S9JQN4_9HYPH|nr:MFS transporter [Phyllobacterium myrsinacearum]PRD55504.1 MFS transporter [Phyllobacterium myrsinacearum]PWV91856.1 FSR family fosmidomycin resistance protein-like MFS transporter [Phyllobacterium myrsinacearum]RZS77305.1 FSR family fosmidomycin resistance protein-like MFS transporter [Phyllobacterium myrsinacearum]RZV05923.1 FSR family fosmidomycin resistance protein-like MFS transporter [Phyllobacterium myrsinacearum]
MTDTSLPAQRSSAEMTAFGIIFAVSFCHLLNDMMQSMLSAIYPMLKTNYGLDFKQIGLLTLTFQVTASLLQPVVGTYTDKRPMPYSLPVGMGFSLVGLGLLSIATHYSMLLIGAAFIGIGSSIFHPESSRVARLASGGRHGLAQSLFQVGGNFGTALGPLLAAFIILPHGQQSIAWFSAAALIGMIVLYQVGNWYQRYRAANAKKPPVSRTLKLPRRKVTMSLIILTLLVFSKNIYLASISSYYTFYVIHKFGITVQQSQLMLFLFLGAAAVGIIGGGLVGDKIGVKTVIWFSILGVLPFTLLMPYANLFWTGVLTVFIGLILSSAFPAIVVFAQELVPGRVGMIAGIFFGFAFGMAGIAAAVLGVVADNKGIDFVYMVCSYLPFLGLLTIFLPSMREVKGEPVAAPA